MPLFSVLGKRARLLQKGQRKRKGAGSWRTQDDGSVLSLERLCLLNLADNMKDVWVKDYANNYLDQYTFRYIMGPFNSLPGELVEELTSLLCSRKQLSKAALHLLLVPQLRGLSLKKCPGLVSSALCGHIVARCQGLWSLDLSGAQQLPSKVLCETIHSLPTLRSLSLAGMPCDRSVIQTVFRCCRSLRHLDVSHCHLLPPAALLLLGGVHPSSSGPSSSSSQSSLSGSSSFSPTMDPLPLGSLLALDIGFGEQEGDLMMAAAYLLLSLPCLERVALEGLAQACCLIECGAFRRADEFSDREGVLRLEDLWRERMEGQGREERGGASGEKDESEEEEESMYLKDEESLEDAFGEEELLCFTDPAWGKKETFSHSGLILQLREVQGATCDSLDSLCRLCPAIKSISVNIDKYEDASGRGRGSLLAADLQALSAQLRSLSFHYLGPLVDLLLPLQVAGSSLTSLTLEGMKTSPHAPLLEVIRACPRLRDLLISVEPPVTLQEEDEEDQRENEDLPRLPNLCSLRLSFSHNHNQTKPVMSWMSLKKVLRSLLIGSPLLEKLCLVSLPCPLDGILQDALRSVNMDSPDAPLLPLGRVKHAELVRTDVQKSTVRSLMQQSERLKYVDLSYCWQVSQLEWRELMRFRKVEVIWV